MAEMSATLKSTLPHLNQTLDKTKLLMDQGRIVSGINLPARQELMMLDTRSAHLVVGFCHLLCFGLVANVRISFALICFVPADQLPNAICFGLVPNE